MTIEKYREEMVSYDRLNALARYYDGRGVLIANLIEALHIIIESNDPENIKITAVAALDLVKEMNDQCHPKVPEWGHLYTEYLSLPPNPMIFRRPEPSPVDKDSLYKSLSIKE
jgi:hypothetical protein